MEYNLKYCPFCGNKYVYLMKRHATGGWRDKYCVLCDYNDGGCGASSGWYHSPDEAAEYWNRRESFTPNEVALLMIEHGQGDGNKFKWGETIKYSPSEVLDILNKKLQSQFTSVE